MNLVDEEDDAALGCGHLVDHALETFLKLTLVFRTGNEGTHVQRIEFLVLQILRHVTADDALGESFDNGGLSRSRFADEHRVVLRSAGENLQDATYLLVATDDGVKFSRPCFLHEVAGIFL